MMITSSPVTQMRGQHAPSLCLLKLGPQPANPHKRTQPFRGIPVRDDDRAGGRSSQRATKEPAAIIGEEGHPEDIQQGILLLPAAFRLLVFSGALLRE